MENPVTTNAEEHRFEAEVEAVLKLVINSLYSNKEIFLRELISNASDALDKLRFRGVTDPTLLEGTAPLAIRVEPDAMQKTLTIADTGIGMTREELQKNLGTIAKSGTREFLNKLESAQKSDVSQIGQFGVGFYSSFLVADRVEVVSRAAGAKEAFKWASDGQGRFTIEPAEREAQGTSIVLFLKESHLDYLRTHELERLIREYSDYLSWPIEMKSDGDDEDAEGEEKTGAYKRINQGTALWQRSAKEVTKEQYDELYKHLSHDWEPSLGHKHFRVEGSTEFAGIIFIPRRPPFDLFSPDAKHGLRLHVKRVFVLEDADGLLPKWLRFVRGVVDSEDLPLNVSRELLQDSRLTKTIQKQVVKQTLDLLSEMAKDKPEDYAVFWKTFGVVLKEGLHFEPEQSKKLIPLLRYETTKSEGMSNLLDVKARMPEGQKSIYYALGESKAQLLASPHIEGLKKRGYEVVLMTDPVDGWAVQGIDEVEGIKLVDVAKAGAELDGEVTEEKKTEDETKTKSLRERMKSRLGEHVSDVRSSNRLVESPACLVMPEGGLPPHLERMLRASQPGSDKQKRILELNPDHTLIQSLTTLIEKSPSDARIDGFIDLVHAQALLAEGSPPEDPAMLAHKLGELLGDAVSRAAV